MSGGRGQAVLGDAEQQEKRQWAHTGTEKFHLNMRKKFFIVQVTMHWSRFPRQAVESPPLEILKNHPDKILFYVLWEDLV